MTLILKNILKQILYLTYEYIYQHLLLSTMISKKF